MGLGSRLVGGVFAGIHEVLGSILITRWGGGGRAQMPIILAFEKGNQEEQNLKVVLSYIVSSRPA